MKAFRFSLYALGLSLALLVGLALYYYPRLPVLLERQAVNYLSDYGVSELALGPISATAERLGLGSLTLSGEMDGLAFELTATALDVDYTFRKLWRGQLDTLTLARLDVAMRQTTTGAADAGEFLLSDLSPYSLLSELPVALLQVDRWQLAYQPSGGEAVTASGSLEWEQELALPFTAMLQGVAVEGRLDAPDPRTLALDLKASDQGATLSQLNAVGQQLDAAGWRWDLGGVLDYATILDYLRGLRPQSGVVALTSGFADLGLEGSCQFQVELHHPDRLGQAVISNEDFLSQFRVEARVSNDIERLDYANSVKGVSARSEFALRLEAGKLEAVLGETELSGELQSAFLGLPDDTRSWLRWGDDVPLHWKNPGESSVTWTSPGRWTVYLADNHLLLGDKGSQFKLSSVDVDATLDLYKEIQFEVDLVARLDSRLRQKQLPQLQLELSQTGNPQDSHLDMQLGDTAQSVALTLLGDLSVESGRGVFQSSFKSLDLAYAASSVTPLLQAFDLLDEALQFNSGGVVLGSEFQTESYGGGIARQRSALHFSDLSGSYGEYRFEGVQLAAEWQGVEKWQTLRPVTFAMAELDMGFAVTDTRASLMLPQPTPLDRPIVNLEQFESGMFGGRVYLSEPQRWNFGSDSNSILLAVEDWRLADIVALQSGQDIQAQGVLEGELPVTVNGGRLIIEKGYLRAREPGGSIRYRPNAASSSLAASSPELGLALDLLEDFQYKVLSSEVQLDPAGNLLLGLSLEGTNPARYDGRLIRFNINLEQNLDPLLQSMRLGDSLVNEVEKGLR